MALESLRRFPDTSEVRGEVTETSKLPDQIEIPRETDRLPYQIELNGKQERIPEQGNKAEDIKAFPDVTDVRDATWKKVNDALSSSKGIQELMEKHPEKIELWQSELKAMETLQDPNATDAERRSAQAKLSALKGQLLETAVKDALSDAGLTVETKQRVVEGQDGGTRPDVIAKNDTDRPIEVFGTKISPGETLSIECKCGRKGYLDQQLRDHIPNQLSGQIGHKALLTTSDIGQVDPNLVKDVCQQYIASLIALDVDVLSVENAIEGVCIL